MMNLKEFAQRIIDLENNVESMNFNYFKDQVTIHKLIARVNFGIAETKENEGIWWDIDRKIYLLTEKRVITSSYGSMPHFRLSTMHSGRYINNLVELNELCLQYDIN